MRTLSLLALGLALAPAAASPVTAAVMPIRNLAADAAAAAALEAALRQELAARVELVPADATRDSLRRLRLRNAETAAPEMLVRLGAELTAGWLVSATLHDSVRHQVPQVTASLRVYSGATGELLAVGFEGRSGLDGQKLLGLGFVGEVEALVPRVARRLAASLPAGAAETPAGESAARLGAMAVLPLTGAIEDRATARAQTLTEAAQAVALGHGIRLVSPNRIDQELRRARSQRWGAVDRATRAALRDRCGADTLLTGSVDEYVLAGGELEPEPRISVSLRLLDAATGRILWMGSLERSGFDGQKLFRLGRIHSPGALAERVVERLIARMLASGLAPAGRPPA